MADELVLGIKVNGADSVTSLKKEYKELQKELANTEAGTDKYYATLKKLGAVKDDIGDLQDKISALNPEGKVQAFQNVAGKLAGGFQAATGAAALFGGKAVEVEKALLKVQAATALAEGIKSVAGLSDGFKVLGTVLKTNPIYLFATVVAGISTALFLLKDKIKAVGEAFDFLGGIFDKVVQGVKDFSDYLGLTTFEIEKQAAAVKKSAQDIIDIEADKIERLLKLAKAKGDDTYELEKQQLNNFIANKQKELEAAEDDAEKKKAIEKSIADYRTDLEVLELSTAKKKSDELLKIKEEQLKKEKELREKEAKELEKSQELFDEVFAKQAKEQDEKDQEAREAKEKAEETEREYEMTSRDQRIQEDLQAKKEAEEEKTRLEAEQQAARSQINAQAMNAAKGLSDAFFAFQLSKAKGNAAEELKIRKQQFAVDKAFSIARAVIDGVRSVQAALTIPPPAGPILAVLNGVVAAANIAKIASTKFEGGSVDVSTPSLPSSGGSMPVAPPTQSIRQDETALTRSGQNQSLTVKAVVVETDVTSNQQRVSKLENQAKFG